jgi:hypothetical protein
VAKLAEEYENAPRDSHERQQLSRRIAALMNTASYETLRRRFNRNLWFIVAGISVAAAGILAFTWAANPPGSSEPTRTTASPAFIPVGARLSLTSLGQRLLKQELGGRSCTSGDIPAVALGRIGNGTDVVVLPKPGCLVSRITLNSTLGTLVPGTSACKEMLRQRAPPHPTSARSSKALTSPAGTTPTQTAPTKTTGTQPTEDFTCFIQPG